ncbi:MAG TPA: Asp23/Gls24 family envelope stress response protein [Candidatus Omnitrophota bacterium]|nr:Asp23/Gls24 family envelope stress response protein [Candidatus Omnitrophota bacterium]MDD4940936.1 Asp23/Gls24 family envelope stress response protein [Candidatus Omnitrophota bacterium]HNQ50141.1 Asp23/Gls24 family envelope stress response protein [Candidatus Omnitrophota bacterium]HQO38196.1 Asp23/Gls24 family envelope stress response protein [Candidatus Omnitrophota bacterium]HQQ06353.1 Asp23/Gls24 family envelope stress response protein [Candidatus Omnitrophota bacterium]
MIFGDETRSDLGAIKIYKSAIASVAAIAAAEVEGVKGVSRGAWIRFLELMGAKATKIRIEIDHNSNVSIDVPLVVKYGCHVPDVANKVQENIRQAVEKATNLSVRDINISIKSIEKP